jgi:hypothetical protein
MTLSHMFARPPRRQLPGRLELAAPALRAVAALGQIAAADAISRAVIAELRLGKRASRRRTRTDSRPFVVHETHFALHLLGKARLLRVVDGQGWQVTDDGVRLLAEGVGDLEISEIVRAARRKNTTVAQELVVALRELPIPPKGVTDDRSPCCYGFQPVTGGDIKIGWTTLGRVWARLDEEDRGPVPLRITAVFAGGRPTERLLHRRNAHLRRRSNREYFRAAPDLALLMHAIPETPGAQEAA